MSWFKIHHLWYRFRCRIWNKYNRITVKTLPSTWNDRDRFLVHVMFQVLTDFIEKEKPDVHIDWDSTKEHRFARDKMDELLGWWRSVYLKFDPYSELTIDYKKIAELEQKIDEELTRRLIELIRIRGHLWT